MCVQADLLVMPSELVIQFRLDANMTLNALIVKPALMVNARTHASSHMPPVPQMQFAHQRVIVLCVNVLQDGLEILTLSASNVSKYLLQ